MIEVAGLRKEFRTRRGQVVGVAGVDFQVAVGEFVGYAGPNGAGKSTTVKMMSGHVSSTLCRWRDPYRRGDNDGRWKLHAAQRSEEDGRGHRRLD